MKKYFAFFLSLVLFICSLPFIGIITSAQTDEVYTIFMADPAVLGEAGTNVTANKSKQTVITAANEDGYFFTFTQNYVSTGSQYGGVSYAKSGHDNNQKGFGWIGDLATLNALSGLVTVSAEVRINQTGYANPNGIDIYLGVACSDTGENTFANGITLARLNKYTTYGEWVEFSNVPETFASCFHNGYLGFKAELRSKANATVVSDFRNIKFTIKESQRDEINEALALKGSKYSFDRLISNYHEVDIIEGEEPEIIDYKIWEANPDNLSQEAGESVKASLTSGAPYFPKYDVIKMTDDGSYYRSNMTVTGSGGDGYNTVLQSGISNTRRGYGWLEDVTVLKTIKPYMTVSFEYRVNAVSGTVPSNGMLYINTSHAYTGKAVLLGSASMANATAWTSEKIKLTGNDFVTWYSGFLNFSIYSYGGMFNGSYNIDLRNFKITLNSSDKLAINAALNEAGSLWKFEDIVQSDPQYNSHNVIWYASPERMGAKHREDVTGSVNTLYLPPKYKTYIETERNAKFYRTEMTVTGKGGDQYNAVFKTGLDSTSEGFGWMSNKNFLNAISPYMYVTFEYRLTGTEAIPNDAYIYYGAASKYGKVSKMGYVKGGSENWKKHTLTVVSETFTKVWSEGYFTFNIYSDSGGFSGTQIIDIRNLRIEFRDCDRLTINESTNKVSGVSSIANFSKGMTRDRDETGTYSYYDMLIKRLPKTRFDANDDDIFNLLDLVRMKKIASGKAWAPTVIKQRLDINGDVKVSSLELVEAKKEILNKKESPYINDPLKVSLVTEHPGVVDMDAYYELTVQDKIGNAISANDVTVTTNNSSVSVNGYNLTVPYSVRSEDKKLTVTVTSKTDNTVFGRYDFEFVKFTAEPTLREDFDTFNTDLWSVYADAGKAEIKNGKMVYTSQVGQTVGYTTKNVFEQAYGSFSASIKMPEKALANGAFWLYSNTGKTYKRNPLNPSQSGGEIDIVEYFPTWSNGNLWSSTVHWYGSSGTHRYSGIDSYNAGVDLGNDYHIYSAVWMKDAIYSYLDGVLYRIYDGEGVSDHSDGMQIILSLHGCSEDSSWGGKFNAADYPDTMSTDWIKVYGLAE